MSVKRVILTADGKDMDVCRYTARGASEIVIVPHVRTFVFFNPGMNVFQIHEVRCGLGIAEGPTIEVAKANATKFFKEANEKMFFIQANAFATEVPLKDISFDEAMKHYTSLRTQIQGN